MDAGMLFARLECFIRTTCEAVNTCCMFSDFMQPATLSQLAVGTDFLVWPHKQYGMHSLLHKVGRSSTRTRCPCRIWLINSECSYTLVQLGHSKDTGDRVSE